MCWSILAMYVLASLKKGTDVLIVAGPLPPPSPKAGKGPHGFRANRLIMTGSVAPPAAAICAWLGTVIASGCAPDSRCPSYAPKKKVLSFQIGPPTEPPN